MVFDLFEFPIILEADPKTPQGHLAPLHSWPPSSRRATPSRRCCARLGSSPVTGPPLSRSSGVMVTWARTLEGEVVVLFFLFNSLGGLLPKKHKDNWPHVLECKFYLQVRLLVDFSSGRSSKKHVGHLEHRYCGKLGYAQLGR